MHLKQDRSSMDIKKVVKEKGYTLTQVANLLGKTKGAMSQIVNGNPNISTLREIAKIIGCQVGDFFRDETTPIPTQTQELTCPYCGKSISITLSKK